MDPFEMPDSAFEPFFVKRIAFAAKRTPSGAAAPVTHSGTVRACIFDEGYADTMAENASASRINCISFWVLRRDWDAAISTPPQQGDRFTSPDTGRTYALTTVTHFAGDTYTIEAREVAG